MVNSTINPPPRPNAKEVEQSNRFKVASEIATKGLKQRFGNDLSFDFFRYEDLPAGTRLPPGEAANPDPNNPATNLRITVGNTTPYRAKVPFPPGRYHSTLFDEYDILLSENGTLTLVEAPAWMAERKRPNQGLFASIPIIGTAAAQIFQLPSQLAKLPKSLATGARDMAWSVFSPTSFANRKFDDEIRRLVRFAIASGNTNPCFDFKHSDQITEDKIRIIVDVCAEFAPYIRPEFTSKGVDANGNPIPNKIAQLLNAQDPTTHDGRKNPYNPFVKPFDAKVAASISARLTEVQKAFDAHHAAGYKPQEEAGLRSHQYKQYTNELNENNGATNRTAAERGKMKTALEGAVGEDRDKKIKAEIDSLEKRAKRLNEMTADLDKYQKSILENIAKISTKENRDAFIKGFSSEAANLKTLKDTLLTEREDILNRITILEGELNSPRADNAATKALQDNIEHKEKSSANLKTESDGLAKDINEVNNKLAKLEQEQVQDAQGRKLPNYDDQKKKLEEDKARLTEEKNKLDVDIKGIQEDIAKLQKEKNEKGQGLGKENSELKAKLETAKTTLAKVDDIVKVLEFNKSSKIYDEIVKIDEKLKDNPQQLPPIPRMG